MTDCLIDVDPENTDWLIKIMFPGEVKTAFKVWVWYHGLLVLVLPFWAYGFLFNSLKDSFLHGIRTLHPPDTLMACQLGSSTEFQCP